MQSHLIQKYNGQLNDGSEYTSTFLTTNDPAKKNAKGDPTNTRPESELKDSRKFKIKLIIGGIIILLLLTGIILAITLSGHKDPVIPPVVGDDIYNPYVIEADGGANSYRTYQLSMDKTQSPRFQSAYLIESQQNKFIENATLKTQLAGSFKTMRIQLYDSDPDAKTYKVSEEYLSTSFVNSADQDNLNFEEFLKSQAFTLELNTDANRTSNQSEFAIRAFHKVIVFLLPIQVEFLNTKDQELFLMSKYQQMSFNIRSQRFFGWGERSMNDLFYNSGNYTIFPQDSEYSVEDGNGTNQGAGAHPLLMFQISGSNRFAGIFLFSSNALSLEIQFNTSSTDWSKITFRATGGMLDFFIFYGPTYEDVVRQYQDVVGRPQMLQLFAHGLFSKSPSYSNLQNSIDAIKGFKAEISGLKMQFSGLSLPMDFQNSNFNKTSSLSQSIRTQYPSYQDIQLITPFSNIVPFTSDQAWVQSFMAGDGNTSYVVRVDNQKLLIEMINHTTNFSIDGYCMDVFNPLFESQFLDQVFLKYQTQVYSGIWLKQNTPLINKNMKEIQQPWVIPYRPDNAFDAAFTQTLPESSQHGVYGTDKQLYHYDVHSIYGSQLALQFMRVLPTKRMFQKIPFVLSDSTFSGLGKTGVAHLLTAQDASYADLKRSLIGMINFGVFGMPNVGLQMCNFASQTNDEELCARYFQLSLVSPLAFYTDRQTDLKHHPFNFQDLKKNSILLSMTQRMEFLMYMRSQLRYIELFGGSLLKPLFADFPSSQSSSDVSTLMFGKSILVAFALDASQTKLSITLPKENAWVSLDDKLTPYPGGSLITADVSLTQKVPMFQRAGSIVPRQNMSNKTQVNDMRNTPVSLSIALKSNKARSPIYIEGGDDVGFQSYYIEIQAENNVISFQQQDLISQPQKYGDTIIEQIYLSFLDKPVNSACALLKDMKTVQSLYATNYNDTSKQVQIAAQNPDQPNATYPLLRINDVAHIFYGDSATNQICDQSLFTYKLDSFTIDNDQFQAKLVQRMSSIYGATVVDQYLRISMISDNSVHIQLSDKKINETVKWETPTEIYDRNFTRQSTVIIGDILSFSQDTDFCFNITLPTDKQAVLFSTCGQVSLQHITHNIFNFEQRKSMPNRFFGLGERKGEFFLENKTTYALYNNNNNVKISNQPQGIIEHGRNGFHPIIYSKLSGSSNLTAVVFFEGHGLEVSFRQIEEGGHFTIASSSKDIDFAFIFNLSPIQTIQAVQNHVKFGTLQKGNLKKYPPPQWALGHHIVVPDDLSCGTDLRNCLQNIKNGTKFPMEGLVLRESDQQKDKGFTLDTAIFNNQSLQYIQDKNLSIIAISKSGYPLNGGTLAQNADLKYISDKSLQVRDSDGTIYQGIDYQGEVIFIDYSKEDSQPLVRYQIAMFKLKYGNTGKYCFQLLKNEISRSLCSEGVCQQSMNDLHPDNWQYQKPGNLMMTYNTLDTVTRSLGTEDQLHNLNGLLEQFAYEAMPNPSLVISDSTSLGSGHLGMVAHQIDYYDLNKQDLLTATQQLQSMSILGLPLISFKFRTQVDVQTEFAERSVLFSSYQPSISTLDFYTSALKSLTQSQIVEFNQLLRFKYVLMAYTRTNLYNHINTGYPFIRPLFFDFDQANIDETISSIYMYGHSIIASTDFSHSAKSYPTNVTICAAQGGLSEDTFCFQNQSGSTMDHKQMVWLVQGTITTLYSFNRTATLNNAADFSGSSDLLMETLDLHVFSDETGSSSGSLLINEGHGFNIQSEELCHMSFVMKADTILFGQITPSDPLLCSAKKGFDMKHVYIYNYRNASGGEYLSGKINSDISLKLESVDANGSVATFTVQPYGIDNNSTTVHINDIQNIIFSMVAL